MSSLDDVFSGSDDLVSVAGIVSSACYLAAITTGSARKGPGPVFTFGREQAGGAAMSEPKPYRTHEQQLDILKSPGMFVPVSVPAEARGRRTLQQLPRGVTMTYGTKEHTE